MERASLWWQRRTLVSLVWASLLCLFSLWNQASCVPRCRSDADCKNNMLCGPGQVCIANCFVAQTTGCRKGFVCAANGVSCSPLSETPAPEQTLHSETPTSEQTLHSETSTSEQNLHSEAPTSEQTLDSGRSGE